MKLELQAKFLQHLNRKKQDEGFTLIELLVVIIIIGILAAIALPSFLNQANKARESEAKSTVGTMNRQQQAYYLENQEFAENSNFARLGLGVATNTSNYSYIIVSGGKDKTDVTNQGRPAKAEQAPVRAYIGGVVVGQQEKTSEATTIGKLCQALQPALVSKVKGEEPIEFNNKEPKCPDTYQDIK